MMIKREVVIRDQTYRVHTWGQPQATAWLFLHGFMGSATDFAPIAASVAGYRISIDLLGFGPDAPTIFPPARLAMPAQIEDLKLLMAALGVTQLRLVGYSMGGRLALGLTVDQPKLVQHLFLESSTAGLQTTTARQERRQHDQVLASQLLAAGLPAFVTKWQALPLFASQQQLPASTQALMRQQRLQQNPQNLANSLRQMGTGQQPNCWPALPQLQVDTTVIVGTQDTKFYHIGQQLQRQLPQAQFVSLAAGHNTHFEVPQQFLAVLRGANDADQ